MIPASRITGCIIATTIGLLACFGGCVVTADKSDYADYRAIRNE